MERQRDGQVNSVTFMDARHFPHALPLLYLTR
ncbi:hypothetical protein BH23BAC4_BH23BAC4_09460 [soil metagenome]